MNKLILTVVFLITGSWVFAGDLATPVTTEATSDSMMETPTTVQPALKKWNLSTVPWDAWFKKNALVTDKTDYVHFFWNAQDFKANFEVKDKKNRLADAALQLVSRLYPVDAKADRVKVDIVYVLERDSYGMPKWDSLQQVAHLEFLKSRASKLTKHKIPLSETQMKKVFDKYEIF